MIRKPSRHCTVELQALPSRIGQVRRIVSAHLRHWHLDPLIDSAALGVTELLTNVHRHAQPDKHCTVELDLLLDRLTVSVRDNDPRVPVVHAAEASATSGRGLALVASVSESWGVRGQDGGGKAVWFTLHAPPAAVRTDAVLAAPGAAGVAGVPTAPPMTAPATPAVPALTPVTAGAPAAA
ncbi:MAG TPA: hypothetical protein DEQ61_23660, partial [Streptomyces sp.]|nr:hypothetical protein [Streptomyces sp.]